MQEKFNHKEAKLHSMFDQDNTRESSTDIPIKTNLEKKESNSETLFVNKNPYIHGTNSNILELLPHTDFSLMEPIDMIEKYGLAPITGEISGGGFDSVWCQCHPCFGRIKGENCNSYDLEKVMKYTQSRSNRDPVILLDEEIRIGSRCCYSNINIILIYLVRCQEFGYDVSKIITSEVIRDIKVTRNAFASLLFFGSNLKPLRDLDDDICNAIYTHFTIDYIKQKIVDSPDLYNIYKHEDLTSNLFVDESSTNSPQDISIITAIMDDIFTLPQNCVVKSGLFCEDKSVDLAITQPFTNTAPDYKSKRSAYEPGYTIYRLTQDCSGYRINDVLERYAQCGLSDSFWTTFHEKLCDYLDKFEHRINLIETMLARTDIHNIVLTNEQYPIIMVCENNELMQDVHNEYRSNHPLELGKDISIIATDTELHRQSLRDYLKKHDLSCKVVLFDDLKM